MIMIDLVNKIQDELFQEGVSTFAILDGASVPDLLDHLYALSPEYECLYAGELEPDMAEVAPYLVRLEPDSEFTGIVLAKGWGGHWGVFCQSSAGLRDLRQHFRRFLTVHDSGGRPLVFRYYDPRVLRIYLPTCAPAELAEIFGPVRSFLIEGETPQALLRFDWINGALELKQRELRGA